MFKINTGNLISNGFALYNLFTDISNSKNIFTSYLTAGGGGNGNEMVKRETKADIWQFIGAFNNGVAKPSKYRMEITLPKGATGTDVNINSTPLKIRAIDKSLNIKDSIAIKCHTMSIPRRGFDTFEVKHNNIRFKVPYGVTYEPVTFTFYADSTLDTLKYFETWQATAMNYSNNTMNFFDEYTSDINLYIINEEGKDVYGVKLIQAYPSNISQIELAYGNVDNLLNISVTFNFMYFVSMESSQIINKAF